MRFFVWLAIKLIIFMPFGMHILQFCNYRRLYLLELYLFLLFPSFTFTKETDLGLIIKFVPIWVLGLIPRIAYAFMIILIITCCCSKYMDTAWSWCMLPCVNKLYLLVKWNYVPCPDLSQRYELGELKPWCMMVNIDESDSDCEVSKFSWWIYPLCVCIFRVMRKHIDQGCSTSTLSFRNILILHLWSLSVKPVVHHCSIQIIKWK